jgi:hypothetical protein
MSVFLILSVFWRGSRANSKWQTQRREGCVRPKRGSQPGVMRQLKIGAIWSAPALSADNNAARAQIANRREILADRFAASELHSPTNPQVEWSTSPLLRIIDTGCYG